LPASRGAQEFRHGQAFTDYKVADISLADWGRKEITIAETEMPGPSWRCVAEFGKEQPLKARASPGCLHMTDSDGGADRDA